MSIVRITGVAGECCNPWCPNRPGGYCPFVIACKIIVVVIVVVVVVVGITRTHLYGEIWLKLAKVWSPLVHYGVEVVLRIVVISHKTAISSSLNIFSQDCNILDYQPGKTTIHPNKVHHQTKAL